MMDEVQANKNSKAFKKFIRQHMALTGMSYMAAMRDLQREEKNRDGRSAGED